MMNPWVPAVGVVLAAIIAAAIARGVALANLRQAWINALREDLADFLSCVDAARRIEVEVLAQIRAGARASRSMPEEVRQRGQELVDKLELLSARIRLRLNPNERAHDRLSQTLEEMRQLKPEPTTAQLLAIVQPILKREWEVTKYGGLGPFVSYARDYVGI